MLELVQGCLFVDSVGYCFTVDKMRQTFKNHYINNVSFCFGLIFKYIGPKWDFKKDCNIRK